MWGRSVTFSQLGGPLKGAMPVVLASILLVCLGSGAAFRASSSSVQAQRQPYLLSPPQRHLSASNSALNAGIERFPKAEGALASEDDRPGAFGLKAQYQLLRRILADNRRARSSPAADEHEPLFSQALGEMDEADTLRAPSLAQQTRLNKAMFIQ